MKRKSLYFVILGLILCVCLYAGRTYNKKSYAVFDKNMISVKDNTNPGEAKMVNGTVDNDGYFSSVRNDREKARAKATDGYNKLIKNPDITSETRQKCESALKEINDDIIKEADAEAMIKAKGIKDVIVFINADSVTVTVNTPKLTSPQLSRIRDVLSEFVSTKNIKIVEVGQN